MSRGRTGVTVCSARRAARYCRAAAGCAAGGAAAAAWLAQAAGYLGPATCRGCTTGHPSTAHQPRQVEAGAEAGGRSNDRYTPPPPRGQVEVPRPAPLGQLAAALTRLVPGALCWCGASGGAVIGCLDTSPGRAGLLVVGTLTLHTDAAACHLGQSASLKDCPLIHTIY